MPRNARGFTVVELLTVMVVIGILAGLALPRLGATTDKARLAALKSDVRNTELAEESYFADTGGYANIDDLQSAHRYAISPGTTLTVSLNPSGYTVEATNSAISSGPNSCRVQFGGGVSAELDGKVTCP